jgi:hypothetical protein
MAVTIEEMEVDVTAPPPAAPSAAGEAQQKKKIDIGAALDILYERKCRLMAD